MYIILLITILFFFPLKAQIIIPQSLISNVVGNADNDVKARIGILGSGSYYNQTAAIENKGSAAGGFAFLLPFGKYVTEGKLKALSFVGKYNLSAVRNFTLRDSIYNLQEVGSRISQQFFSYDNNNNFNFGLRYSFLNRADNNDRLFLFNLFADVNITTYKHSVDSTLSQNIETQMPNLKLSSGFNSINPVIGLNCEWSFKAWGDNENQRLGPGLALAGTANIVYENDEGKNFIPSWAYIMRGGQAIQDNNFNKKLNNIYGVYGKFYFFVNDIYLFFILQKNFTAFSNSELEIQGINNRPVFFNFGVTFSPTLFFR